MCLQRGRARFSGTARKPNPVKRWNSRSRVSRWLGQGGEGHGPSRGSATRTHNPGAGCTFVSTVAACSATGSAPACNADAMAEDVSEPDDRSRTQVGAAPLAPSGVTLPSRWELVRPLGSGGQAQVWLARDEEFSEWVAIEIFRDDLTAVQRERLRREVRLGRSLQHRGVVRIFELLGRLFASPQNRFQLASHPFRPGVRVRVAGGREARRGRRGRPRSARPRIRRRRPGRETTGGSVRPEAGTAGRSRAPSRTP